MAGTNEEVWLAVFQYGHPQLKAYQRLHRSLPPWRVPRKECKLCYAPYEGLGGILMRLRGKVPSVPNPDYCTACNYFIRTFPGGAEVELSILFIDVRGSGKIASRLTPTHFSHLMQDFYRAATESLIVSDGFILDFMGDAVVAVWPPGFVGKAHACKAIEAAESLLRLTVPVGANGMPLPIGIGIHSAVAFIGTFEGAKGGIQDVRAVGDSVNVAAGLSQLAGPYEALITEATFEAAGINPARLELRRLSVKGRDEPVAVRILRKDSPKLFVQFSEPLRIAS
jgi:adenylate cyclase